mgnify:CR=1 FL=1
MLRAFFISLSKATWAQRLITHWGFAWRAASRFIAGESGEEAIQAVRQLNASGILATLDHLGENTSSAAEARNSTDEILQVLDQIHISGVRSNVSIKLSQIGLLLDDELCLQNLTRILQKAQLTNNFVRIDMEDSSLTVKTLDALRWARAHGFFNVGIVIQSYLYRSTADVRSMIDEGIRVRLVKGAYQELASVAYPAKEDVDKAFDQLAEHFFHLGRIGIGMNLRADQAESVGQTGTADHDQTRADGYVVHDHGFLPTACRATGWT